VIEAGRSANSSAGTTVRFDASFGGGRTVGPLPPLATA